MGIVTTIFGSTLKPFVSSSKNRKRPALDAGNGAPFFLLLISTILPRFYNKNFIVNFLTYEWFL